MTFGSLFAGIGGFDLGLERAGMRCLWQVENDPYCVKVLEKHWPDVKRYGDITSLDPGVLEPADLICGGFPCQPVSYAGKRRGEEDSRWLWPEMCRVVRGVRPRYVLVENVPGLLNRGMGAVLGDLAACGYDAEWDCIPAAAFGAPHLRFRVFILAHAQGTRQLRASQLEDHREGEREGWRPDLSECGEVSGADVPHTSGKGLPEPQQVPIFGKRRGEEGRAVAQCDWWAVEPNVGRVAHGVPSRVDRLRCLGNAIVPQVAEWLGRRIREADASLTAQA